MYLENKVQFQRIYSDLYSQTQIWTSLFTYSKFYCTREKEKKIHYLKDLFVYKRKHFQLIAKINHLLTLPEVF